VSLNSSMRKKIVPVDIHRHLLNIYGDQNSRYEHREIRQDKTRKPFSCSKKTAIPIQVWGPLSTLQSLAVLSYHTRLAVQIWRRLTSVCSDRTTQATFSWRRHHRSCEKVGRLRWYRFLRTQHAGFYSSLTKCIAIGGDCGTTMFCICKTWSIQRSFCAVFICCSFRGNKQEALLLERNYIYDFIISYPLLFEIILSFCSRLFTFN
jgi:hypothetical protein